MWAGEDDNITHMHNTTKTMNNALYHIHQYDQHDGYVIVGILEEMDKTFELLKCAYPTYFASSVEEIHANPSKHTYEHHLLDEYFLRKCERSKEDLVYEFALSVLLEKYNEMKSNPKCCRQPKIKAE